MLAIEVELLTGCFTATRFNDRDSAEWPPHPARLYSALVNAWGVEEEPSEAEADALRWLEGLPDPDLSCSVPADVAVRSVVTHYVPDNDPSVTRDLTRTYEGARNAESLLSGATAAGDEKAMTQAAKALTKAMDKVKSDSLKASSTGTAPDSAMQVLPDHRGKQARTYPAVRPDDPVVTYIWPDASPPPDHRRALDDLLRRVGRLGHSSTLVACRLVDESSSPTLVAREDGESVLRLPGVGQFERLCELFETHQGNGPRQLPARMVRYGTPRPVGTQHPRSIWGHTFLALTLADGPMISVRDSLDLARLVRDALLSHAGRSGAVIPELISGHAARSGGSGSTPRSVQPHIAVVPLPFVGGSYGDGLVKGIAVICPEGADEADRQRLLQVVGSWLASTAPGTDTVRNLWTPGRSKEWLVTREGDHELAASLRRTRWEGPATRWSTVTPLVLDRYPDALWSGSAGKRARGEAQATASIVEACERIGLPRPVAVELRADAPIRGTQPVRRHPPFRSGQRNAARPLVHALIDFAEPVIGPVILGRGRYLGQGLCLPLTEVAR